MEQDPNLLPSGSCQPDTFSCRWQARTFLQAAGFVTMGKYLKQNVKYSIQIPEQSGSGIDEENAEHLKNYQSKTTTNLSVVISTLQIRGGDLSPFF
jgi:hypothetical protein